MWRYTGPQDPTRDYAEGKRIFDLALDFGLLRSGLMDVLSVCTDLSQAEIDLRVKLVCEKSPPPGAVAPRILAVLPTTEKIERLKVIDG